MIVLSPNPEWIATLPNAKLPDRADFKFFGDDVERLRDEFAAWVGGRTHIEVKPLV